MDHTTLSVNEMIYHLLDGFSVQIGGFFSRANAASLREEINSITAEKNTAATQLAMSNGKLESLDWAMDPARKVVNKDDPSDVLLTAPMERSHRIRRREGAGAISRTVKKRKPRRGRRDFRVPGADC